MEEFFCFALVAISFLFLAAKVFRTYLASPLAAWLLEKGKVGLAMRLKFWGYHE